MKTVEPFQPLFSKPCRSENENPIFFFGKMKMNAITCRSHAVVHAHVCTPEETEHVQFQYCSVNKRRYSLAKKKKTQTKILI